MGGMYRWREGYLRLLPEPYNPTQAFKKFWGGGGVVVGWVAHKILVSAPFPLELIWTFGPGFDWAGPRGLGQRVWDLGLTTNKYCQHISPVLVST